MSTEAIVDFDEGKIAVYATTGSRGIMTISVPTDDDDGADPGLLGDFLEDGSRRRLKQMRSRYEIKDSTEAPENNLLDRVRENSQVSDQQRWIRCRLHWFGEESQAEEMPSFESQSELHQYLLENHFGSGQLGIDETHLLEVGQYDNNLYQCENNLSMYGEDFSSVHGAFSPVYLVEQANFFPVASTELAATEIQYPNSTKHLELYEDYRKGKNRDTVWDLKKPNLRKAGSVEAAGGENGDRMANSDGDFASMTASGGGSLLNAEEPKMDLSIPDDEAGAKASTPVPTEESAEAPRHDIIDCRSDGELRLLPSVCRVEETYNHSILVASFQIPFEQRLRLHDLSSFAPMCDLNAAWIHLLSGQIS